MGAGAGLRQAECLSLRVKDIDFAYRQILVRDGKGAKDRVTMLPENLVQPLQAHLGRVRLLHARDLKEGFGEVRLPYALRASIRVPGARGRGSTCFRPRAGRPIPRAERCAATTCIRTR